MGEWEEKKVLILVKTYPDVSRKHVETVCTAGITDKGKLIRLYPISFRYLSDNQKFEKYRCITVDTKRNPQDLRPESFKVNYDSIKCCERFDATKDSFERRKWVEPLVSPSLEYLINEQKKNNTSLGIFKPKEILDFIPQKEENIDWTEEEKIILSQASIFDTERKMLQKMPYKFKFVYKCDDPSCNGHDMVNWDWEICETYRNFKKIYGEKEALIKLKDKWLSFFYDKNNEFHFIVGTHHVHKNFLLIGHVNLKKVIQEKMF